MGFVARIKLVLVRFIASYEFDEQTKFAHIERKLTTTFETSAYCGFGHDTLYFSLI